jgi:hypothetical protein
MDFIPHESPPPNPPVNENPYASPLEAPTIRTAGTADSPLVRKLRRSTGNDQVVCALIATLMAHCIPLGFLFHVISLGMLARLVWIRARPATWAVVVGVLTGLWNLAVLGILSLAILIGVLSR